MIGIPFQIIYQPELKESVKEIFHDIFTLLVRKFCCGHQIFIVYMVTGNKYRIKHGNYIKKIFIHMNESLT